MGRRLLDSRIQAAAASALLQPPTRASGDYDTSTLHREPTDGASFHNFGGALSVRIDC